MQLKRNLFAVAIPPPRSSGLLAGVGADRRRDAARQRQPGLQFSPMVGVFEEAGFGLQTPDMCWSDRRQYDKPPLECMADVDRAVGRLEADGYDQIVIAGHSMGGINTELTPQSSRPCRCDPVRARRTPGPPGDRSDRRARPQPGRQGSGCGRTGLPHQRPAVEDDSERLARILGPDSVLDDKALLPRITAPILGPQAPTTPDRRMPPTVSSWRPRRRSTA